MELTDDQRWEFENDELNYIGDLIKDGNYSGVTPYGTSWSISINFDYDNAPDELGLDWED